MTSKNQPDPFRPPLLEKPNEALLSQTLTNSRNQTDLSWQLSVVGRYLINDGVLADPKSYS